MSNFRITVSYAEGVKLNPQQAAFRKLATAILEQFVQELNGTVVHRHLHTLHQRLKAGLNPQRPEVRLSLVENLSAGVQPRIEVYAQRSGGDPLWTYTVDAVSIEEVLP